VRRDPFAVPTGKPPTVKRISESESINRQRAIDLERYGADVQKSQAKQKKKLGIKKHGRQKRKGVAPMSANAPVKRRVKFGYLGEK
jgi:hypothetical protein